VKRNDTAQEVARAFFETLNGIALQQLSDAVDKVKNIKRNDKLIQKQIDAALPSNALPQVRNFLLSLANEGALAELPSIVEEYETLILAGPRATEAEVTSAIPLDQKQQDRISRELQQQYGVPTEYLRFRVDDSLIGGLIIRIGDKVFDNSLRARLGTVQRSMLMS
jgi:F-type H+-transporting ATPase subunit delta